MRLLLLSNSRNKGEEFLGYPESEIKDFLGTKIKHALFIPFAAVDLPFDQYNALVEGRMNAMGYSVTGIHTVSDPLKALGEAQAIMIGGGNTWQLLSLLYKHEILDLIRERVLAGAPYIGWSAGSNVACPTIKTTNDMPIIEPPSFNALGLVPFQLNAHYSDFVPEGHRAETRDDRLREFTIANPGVTVVGLREGTLLRREKDSLKLVGPEPARIFLDCGFRETEITADLSALVR